MDAVKIELRSVSADQVTATADFQQFRAAVSQWPVECGLAELGAAVNRIGASQACGSGEVPTSINTRAMFMRPTRSNLIFATARSIHSANDVAVWRTVLSDGYSSRLDECFAEFTHTFRIAVGTGQPNTVNAPDRPVEKDFKANGSRDRDAGRGRMKLLSDREHRIYEGALQVMSKKGYARSTMRDIAAAAEIPVATVYKHIKTKEDVLFMIARGCLSEIFEQSRRAISAATDAEQKVRNAVRSYLSYLDENRSNVNLLYREMSYLTKRNRDKVFELERRCISLWEEIIVFGKQRGEFRVSDTRLAADMSHFFCTVWALRHWNIRNHDTEDVRSWLDRFILRGLQNWAT